VNETLPGQKKGGKCSICENALVLPWFSEISSSRSIISFNSSKMPDKVSFYPLKEK
jgi:hypothetical protein